MSPIPARPTAVPNVMPFTQTDRDALSALIKEHVRDGLSANRIELAQQTWGIDFMPEGFNADEVLESLRAIDPSLCAAADICAFVRSYPEAVFQDLLSTVLLCFTDGDEAEDIRCCDADVAQLLLAIPCGQAATHPSSLLYRWTVQHAVYSSLSLQLLRTCLTVLAFEEPAVKETYARWLATELIPLTFESGNFECLPAVLPFITHLTADAAAVFKDMLVAVVAVDSTIDNYAHGVVTLLCPAVFSAVCAPATTDALLVLADSLVYNVNQGEALSPAEVTRANDILSGTLACIDPARLSQDGYKAFGELVCGLQESQVFSAHSVHANAAVFLPDE